MKGSLAPRHPGFRRSAAKLCGPYC
jgi:hypothetical protein